MNKIQKNEEFVHLVCKSNVRNTMAQVRSNSPVLKEMEEAGQIRIVGAIYDLNNGKVAFLDR